MSFQEFSGCDTPGPSQREGATPSHTQHPARPGAVFGPKPWSHSTFQPWLRPYSQVIEDVITCLTLTLTLTLVQLTAFPTFLLEMFHILQF